MQQLEIYVTGTGTAIHAAERGILKLKAQSQELRTIEEASKTVTITANQIRDIIAPHCPQDEQTGRTKSDAAISHYSMSTLETHSKLTPRPREKDEEIIYDTTYSAAAEYTIKFSDFSLLDSLASELAAMKNVKIDRLTWALTDDTRKSLMGGARIRAAQDAMQRARDYAEAFTGLSAEETATRVKAKEAREQNNNYCSSTRPKLHYGKRQRAYGKVEETSELQFQPEDVRLEVRVDCKFAIDM
ncbi:hypothetical protein N0V94_006733 [Neodidymelliopsis sp. IMI 364377]|nr:hypothetical protein N0V94_006733 [Neodidymelliopsis sp. IMI 364377]